MKVAAIGAGISGLTLAAALRQLDPRVEVELYERDTDVDGRFQGYSLGIKGEGGVPVLRRLGLFDRLRPEMVPITNFVFCDQGGRPLLELPGGGGDKHLNLRVKRSRLRDALRRAAPEVTIRYGMRCTGYRLAGDRVEVRFADGQTVAADYVVATDGVGSALRQQLVGDARRYLGLTCIVGQAPVAPRHPLLAGGYFLTLGDGGASVFCYREAGGTHLSFTQHAASEDALAAESAEALVRRVRGATAAWHAPVPEVAAALDPASVVVRGYYDKEPVGRVRDGRLWLIGDAAHPMCPFQGQGANMAMLDALKLGEWLAARAAGAGGPDPDGRLLEADVVARGRKAVLESRSAAMQFHTRSRFKQTTRNLGFRLASRFIGLFSRPRPAAAAP